MAALGVITLVVFIPTQISQLSAAILATGVSPRVFPQLAAAGLVVLGSALTLQDVVRTRKARAGGADEVREPIGPDPLAASIFFAAIVLYVVALPILGHPIATPLAVAGLMYLLGERVWIRIAVAAVATTAFLSLFFRILLNTLLPSGVLF